MRLHTLMLICTGTNTSLTMRHPSLFSGKEQEATQARNTSLIRDTDATQDKKKVNWPLQMWRWQTRLCTTALWGPRRHKETKTLYKNLTRAIWPITDKFTLPYQTLVTGADHMISQQFHISEQPPEPCFRPTIHHHHAGLVGPEPSRRFRSHFRHLKALKGP